MKRSVVVAPELEKEKPKQKRKQKPKLKLKQKQKQKRKQKPKLKQRPKQKRKQKRKRKVSVRRIQSVMTEISVRMTNVWRVPVSIQIIRSLAGRRGRVCRRAGAAGAHSALRTVRTVPAHRVIFVVVRETTVNLNHAPLRLSVETAALAPASNVTRGAANAALLPSNVVLSAAKSVSIVGASTLWEEKEDREDQV